MTPENHNLGIIPIFYLFLSGSSDSEQEFSDGKFSGNDENLQKSSLTENGWMNQSNGDEKKSSI